MYLGWRLRFIVFAMVRSYWMKDAESLAARIRSLKISWTVNNFLPVGLWLELTMSGEDPRKKQFSP